MRATLIGILLTVSTAGAARAQIPAEAPSLDPFFGSNMVLPREVPVPITGSTAPGAAVEVSFGDDRAAGLADGHGRFRIELPAQPLRDHSETLFVRAGGGTTRCDDVLVGDVYLCAGQSNMAFELRASTGGAAELAREMPEHLRLLRWAPRLSTGGVQYPVDEVRGHDAESLYVRSPWTRPDPESAARFSAVAWHFGRRMAEATGIPVGLVATPVGGSPTEAWLPLEHLASSPSTRAFTDGWLEAPGYPPWCQERARQNLAAWIESGAAVAGRHAFEPGILFEAGVRPFAAVPIRAVLWYQGESNATLADPAGRPTDPEVQVERLRDLVTTWRNTLGQPDLTFLMVQLPGLRRAWVEYRDAQTRIAADDPDVHLAITLDVGHPTDVHPRDKAPVGDRLARLALRHLHAKQEIATGPRIARVEFETTGRALVRFTDAAGMTTSDGAEIRGFALAGDDLLFCPAEATLASDGTVHVAAADVPHPSALRYAWQDDPWPNLVDGSGLPLAPHRTDRGPLRPRLRVANLAGLPERALEAALGPAFKVGTFSGPQGPTVSVLWEPDLAVVRSEAPWSAAFPAVRWQGTESDAGLAALAAEARSVGRHLLTRRR
jgi:sialate O-acetylesterase